MELTLKINGMELKYKSFLILQIMKMKKKKEKKEKHFQNFLQQTTALKRHLKRNLKYGLIVKNTT